MFSDYLTIIFDREDDIDYSALKNYLDGNLSAGTLYLSNQLSIHFDTNTIVVVGYRLQKGLYITSTESDSFHSIPCPLEPKVLKILLSYLYHIRMTV
jgi:hypothetical protein